MYDWQQIERMVILKLTICGQPTIIVGIYAVTDNVTKTEKDQCFSLSMRYTGQIEV